MKKYKYDHDCPFEAFVTNSYAYNNGVLIGKWVKFPTSKEVFNASLEQIYIFDNKFEWFISDYDIYKSNIKNRLSSFLTFEELNQIAKEEIEN